MATTPPIEIKPLVIGDLTSTKVDGEGAFDVLMRATKAHLEEEFRAQRIRGPEYATVYLGGLEQVMQTAMQFLMNAPKAALEAQLIGVQIELAKVEVLKAEVQRLQIVAQTELLREQVLIAKAELEIRKLELQKVPAEIALLEQQVLKIKDDILTGQVQRLNLAKQGLQIEAQTRLVTQQTSNAVIEGTVLVAQECKLRAEYDLTMQSVLKSAQEVLLLQQKVLTEKAQVTGINVDEDSVIGRQKALYKAQTDGFKRDAEQKVAKIMIDTWNVRRTTDEGTVADGVNKLNDEQVGRAVTAMFTGIQA